MASVVQGISNVIGGLFQSIFGLINHAWNLVLSIFATAWSAVEGVVNAALHTITGLLSTVTHVFGDLVGIVTGELADQQTLKSTFVTHADPFFYHPANLVPIAVVGGGVVLLSVLAGSKDGNGSPVKKAKASAGRKKKA